MGTSNAFGGASGETPLVPSWLEDGGSDGGALSDPPSVGSGDEAPPAGNDSNAPPTAPPERPAPPVPGEADRYTSARTNFTRYARSGGDDRRSMGRAVSQYVTRSSGGAAQAATRMGSSRGAASRLVGVLGRVGNEGIRVVLRSLDLGGLAGRPIEEVFAGLADFICPDGGSIDEGIARDAFIETIADLAEAGITEIDGLTADQMQTVFELYIAHTIEARICNDIGTRVVNMPSDVRTVERIEAQLQEFIQRSVSDAVSASGVDLGSISQDNVTGFVNEVYEATFELLEAAGEAEAEA